MDEKDARASAHAGETWRHEFNRYTGSFCIYDSNDAFIAEVGDISAGHRRQAEAYAEHARLIAAAPELLEACDRALEHEHECFSEGSDDISPDECLHCVLLNAISNAKGN